MLQKKQSYKRDLELIDFQCLNCNFNFNNCSLRLPFVEPVAYSGDRTLKALSDGVMNFVSAPFFTPITSLEIEKLKKENEVAFFLVFNPTFMEKSILVNLLRLTFRKTLKLLFVLG